MEYPENLHFIPIDFTKENLETKLTRHLFRKVGEPRKTGEFNPSILGEDLASLGFHLKENLSPIDTERRYLKGCMDKHHTLGYMNFACAVIINPT